MTTSAPDGTHAAVPTDPSPARGEASNEPALASAEEARDTRDELLRRTAHELFSEHGLGVPLADIAKSAGVGVATFYRRYRNKDILILDAYREQMAIAQGFAETANTYEDPWTGIVYFLRHSTEQLALDRGMRELVLGGYIGGAGWARGSTHEELLTALDAMEKHITSQLDALVARARDAKAVRSDFQPTDLLLMSAMAHAALPVDATGQTELSQRALQLLIEGIRPPAGT